MKNLTEFLGSFKKYFVYGARIRPTRDWFVMLLVTLVLLVVSVGWNVFMFTQFENGKSTTQTTPLAQEQGVGDAVAQVQALFQQRATEEGNYQRTYHFVDPSLPGS